MQSRPVHIHILMPDDSTIDVSYYCSDEKLPSYEKKKFTQLYIQLHDCICVEKIGKHVSTKVNELESIVHNKVIIAKGHLC